MKNCVEDVEAICALPLPWEKLDGKTVWITGASGLVGSFLVAVLLRRGVRVVAFARNEVRARERFGAYWDNPNFRFISCDVNDAASVNSATQGLDANAVLVHAASNTHPMAYATDPIGTITANTIGAHNLLVRAADAGIFRFVYLSSVEVYGENRGDTEYFDEHYCGSIDCNTLRAGYPESKRLGEALCQAFIAQRGLDIVIPRLSRTYGPTMRKSDTKAISQFLLKGKAKEDIVLKSEGTQLYSYQHVADAVSGLLTILLSGKSGEAYNIASPDSDITLRDLASLIAEAAGTKVVFDLPSATEAAGYSKATKAILDGSKLRALGWKPRYNIRQGILQTLQKM